MGYTWKFLIDLGKLDTDARIEQGIGALNKSNNPSAHLFPNFNYIRNNKKDEDFHSTLSMLELNMQYNEIAWLAPC